MGDPRTTRRQGDHRTLLQHSESQALHREHRPYSVEAKAASPGLSNATLMNVLIKIKIKLLINSVVKHSEDLVDGLYVTMLAL